MSIFFDGHKLLHHLDRLIPWSEGEKIFPLYIAFGPTSFCQCQCVFCPFHSQKHPQLPFHFPFERFSSLIYELKEVGVKSLFFSGTGEPLLHPNIYEMVEKAHEGGLSVALNSNGLNLSLDNKKLDLILNNLDWCRFSINGHDGKSYSKTHGVNEESFERVLKNIHALALRKKTQGGKCTIGVQSLYLGQSKDELIYFVSRLRDFGVDYFSLKPFLSHEASLLKEEFIPALDSLNELEKLTTKSFKVVTRSSFKEKKNRIYNKCFSFDFMCEIDSDGEVYTCGAKVSDKNFSYGSILDKSFSEVWMSEKRQAQIEEIHRQLDVQTCMPHCRHHEVNNWLWSYCHPPEHRNFI